MMSLWEDQIVYWTGQVVHHDKFVNINFHFSRYPNVSAYDHSRVHISHNNEDLYINANLVRSTEADRKYILTQGKLNTLIR